MASTLKVGDKVRLYLGGGPAMTVHSMPNESSAVCGWHDGNDITVNVFKVENLRKVGE